MILLFEISLTALFLVALVHGSKYGLRRLLTAFLLIGLICTLEENVVMTLTGNYAYQGYHLWVGELPVAIALAWVVVAYLGFQLSLRVNSLLATTSVASIDALLEPLAYNFNLWTWYPTVPSPVHYFDAPIGNAIGWVILTYIGIKILSRATR